MTVIPATPRRVSRGSVVSYKPETDKEGKLKFSTKLRRLFGLGPKREEVSRAELGMMGVICGNFNSDADATHITLQIKAPARTAQYVYPSGSSTHRRSTSRGSNARVVHV
ncbi:hypothetical protein FRC07_012496 [Ceratobasidium sp. 392]|nr:hypothetical protein FRC07_012496 [Ceratobasidium sp. 392]